MFSTEVKVVNVLATVRDKSGRIIPDLGKEDFAISENGRPQTIKYFARESGLPLILGLLIDTSMSQQRVLDAERAACFRFLDQVLRPAKDRVFVMQFDMGVFLKQPLTSSRKSLEETLPYVDTPTQRELEMQRGGGTLLYDAVVKGSKDIMERQTGRKALIILSELEAAVKTDTIIYSILFSDASYYGGFAGGGRHVMERLAKETGGGFFEVSKKHPIDEAFGVLEEELRSQYSLGYVSDTAVEVSEFRKLSLSVSRKGLKVQARDRYWARR